MSKLLLGNMADIAPEDRQVSADEGEALAAELHCGCFFETSAKHGTNVDTAFAGDSSRSRSLPLPVGALRRDFVGCLCSALAKSIHTAFQAAAEQAPEKGLVLGGATAPAGAAGGRSGGCCGKG